MSGDGDIVLVTGAAGFVGSAVTRALVAAGHRVRVTVRATSNRGNLSDFAGEIVEGDLRDRAAVDRAMTGVGTLFHVAADYRLWARDSEEIVRNNRAMTETVMNAALAAGVGRIVYTSSVATLRPESGGSADETRPASEAQAIGAYKRSKVVAERLVAAMVAERGLPAVIVNPSTPIGPRDIHPTPTGRIIVEAANGRMPAFVDSGLNLVHVDDVAAGHLAALAKGRIGERYILGGQNATLAELLREIARAVGRKPPTLALPRGPLFPLAWANEQIAKVTGRDPFLTLDALRMARHHMYFRSTKAERELGYRARPYQEGLIEAITWFRAAGMIA
jgi:dihydroflavonol-4-reductase